MARRDDALRIEEALLNMLFSFSHAPQGYDFGSAMNGFPMEKYLSREVMSQLAALDDQLYYGRGILPNSQLLDLPTLEGAISNILKDETSLDFDPNKVVPIKGSTKIRFGRCNDCINNLAK